MVTLTITIDSLSEEGKQYAIISLNLNNEVISYDARWPIDIPQVHVHNNIIDNLFGQYYWDNTVIVDNR